MITTTREITRQVRAWQTEGLKVVLVTGVFDLLHIEHIRFLEAAKAVGDKLIVGVETDRRVRAIKGTNRPINSLAVRSEQLEALKPVDRAFSLPSVFSREADWDAFMRDVKPDVYAVSSHSSYLENKRVISEKYGILFQVVRPHNPDYSSSKIAYDVARFVKDN